MFASSIRHAHFATIGRWLRPFRFLPLATALLVGALGLLWLVPASVAQEEPASKPETSATAPPVTVTDDGANYILANGYLTATINKKTGDMTSLKVHDIETQGYVSGHHAGYWEQNPNGAARMESKLTVDPAGNGGERGEVSIKGWSDGKNLNGVRRAPGPGAAVGGAPGEASYWSRCACGDWSGTGDGTCAGAERPAGGAGPTASGSAAQPGHGHRSKAGRRWRQCRARAAGRYGDSLRAGSW